MTNVTIEVLDGRAYRVTVTDSRSSSTHEVTADPDDVARFAGGASVEDLIEASFRFLLDREPKESILSRFDLSIISKYFSEYEARISDYL